MKDNITRGLLLLSITMSTLALVGIGIQSLRRPSVSELVDQAISAKEVIIVRRCNEPINHLRAGSGLPKREYLSLEDALAGLLEAFSVTGQLPGDESKPSSGKP